jgi:hypothetical protein
VGVQMGSNRGCAIEWFVAKILCAGLSNSRRAADGKAASN